MIPLHPKARGVLCLCAVALAVAACDDDPSAPKTTPLTASVVRDNPTDTVIGRQEAIRVVFNDSIDTRTALDQQNFVVIDSCTGLRVAGSLRLRGGDTLEFTPSRALQFLTPLKVRVQNILNTHGQALGAPFTFSLITEAPPVGDVSWSLLDSPTNDFVSGITFRDRNTGWISTLGGAIYKTSNGGQQWAALYKNPDLIITFGIRVAGQDTLLMVAAPSFGGTTFTTYGLFRSIDGGRSFDTVFTKSPSDMNWPSVYKPAAGKPVVVIGGDVGTLAAWRYDFNTDSIYQFGPVANQVGYRAAISKDGTHALMTGEEYTFAQGVKQGFIYRSSDGGRHYTPVTAPAGGLLSMYGGGFRDGSNAIVVGARSQVFKMDGNGVLTKLGPANGIPQTDSSANTIITYNFVHVEFTAGGQIGWMIGFLNKQEVGQPQVTRGLIYQTRDGGNTWTRQAVSGTGDNGLGFEATYDLSTIGPDFSAVAGDNGFIGVRASDTQIVAGACSFTEQPTAAFLQH